ncbi:hypothetical protein [Brevibacillus parabrevis]|uniref:hypothetical protein n=1 Tax=Brevibacillus parabrevis TaxID=54914 RepID=UPI002E22F47E|nr:hypothetical protein [Brevibacillus parabrevis]
MNQYKCHSLKIVLPVVFAVSVLAVPFVDELSTVSAAKTDSEAPAEKIPETMEPGTIITFDENNKMIVHPYEYKEEAERPRAKAVQKQKPDKEEKAVLAHIEQERVSLPVYYDTEPELPAPHPGMTVYYDGMGYPTKIVAADGKLVDYDSASIGTSNAKALSTSHAAAAGWTPPKNGEYVYGKNNENKITITDNYVMGEGWVTWYDGEGKTGSDNKKLKNNNCATKMKYDRPPYNTEIRVRNVENDIVKETYKGDIGGLPHAVLDIMPDFMEQEFETKVDKKKGTGRFKGRTYHEK